MRSRWLGIVTLLCATVGVIWLVRATAYAGYAPPDVVLQITRAAMTATTRDENITAETTPIAPISTTHAIVVNVVDGDTITIRSTDGLVKPLRYVGVSAPEDQANVCFGRAATEFNRSLLLGKQVLLERDVSDMDKYGRLLRYVYLTDGRMVNEELVKAGYAQVTTFLPDVRHAQRLLLAQRDARAKVTGVWGACDATAAKRVTPTPATKGGIVGTGCSRGCEVPPSGCAIKGNISKSGQKIYHVPGQSYYDQTKISPEYGERWFCTDAEAIANGWRKSLK